MRLKTAGLLTGVLVPVLIVQSGFSGNPGTTAMAAIAVMMAIFWMTEAIPLTATALLPLALFPLSGIASSNETAAHYMNSTVFLLIGGFMIALAMQRWNLHKRIALNIILCTGERPVALVCGFMLATAFLSMWISNTATTLVMLPIAIAVIGRCQVMLSEQQARQFGSALLLVIAYSASIGGMMTLVGSAPNLVFARAYQVATMHDIGFLQWMMIAMPLAITLLLILLGVIYYGYLKKIPHFQALSDLLLEEKLRLGDVSDAEKSVLLIFVLTAMLWISRKGIAWGGFVLPGWAHYLPFGDLIDDGSVAMTMATVMFFIPASKRAGAERILDEAVFVELPWSVVLLFGGGFALAYGFSQSGLSAYLAGQLQGLKSVILPLLILIVTMGMSLLTELTSNTATTQVVMPILLATSDVIDVSPVWLMLPVVLAASCAFMFPVATPPNAIVFGSGKVAITEMLKIGVILNFIAVLLISAFCYVLIPIVLNME